MTASASENSLTGMQQSVPPTSPAAPQLTSTWEQQQPQQQQQEPAASIQPPPPPPPKPASPQVSPDAAQAKNHPVPEQPPLQEQQEQPGQQPAPAVREHPAFAGWAKAKAQQPQQEPVKEQPPPPTKTRVEEPTFKRWARGAPGPLARAASASAAATSAIISNTDPVVSWNPSGVALAPEERSPPAAAQAPVAEGPPTQDQIVAPPKRTASLSRIFPAAGGPADTAAMPGWAQMGGWGRGDGGLGGVAVAATSIAPPAASVAPAAVDAFDPFGDNPLHRALAADYRRDPVVAQPARKAPGAGPLLRPSNPAAQAAPPPRPALPQPGEHGQTLVLLPCP